MPPVAEGMRAAEFLVSEANGFRSREVVTVTGATALEPGTILGRVTGSGSYVRQDTAAGDGSEVHAAILLAAYEGTETTHTVIIRDAEVNKAHLIYEDSASAGEITAADEALAALGIIVR